MKINEEYLEIIPLNPLLAKEHMYIYREGRGYLDDFLELGEDFHLYTFKYHAKLLLDLYKSPEDYPVFMIKYGKRVIGTFIFATPKFLGGVQLIYMIRKGYAGRGVATLALQKLAERAFYGHKYLHVELHIDIDNIPSKKVAEKAGFVVIDGYSDTPIGKKGSGNIEVFALVNKLPKEFVRQIPREEWMANHDWTPGEHYFKPRGFHHQSRRLRRTYKRR